MRNGVQSKLVIPRLKIQKVILTSTIVPPVTGLPAQVSFLITLPPLAFPMPLSLTQMTTHTGLSPKNVLRAHMHQFHSCTANFEDDVWGKGFIKIWVSCSHLYDP
jgi:hypothetical protein